MTAHAPVTADPVAAFMPWVEGTERNLRRRLLAFQHRAGSRARLCQNDRARSLWWTICDTAADNAFAQLRLPSRRGAKGAHLPLHGCRLFPELGGAPWLILCLSATRRTSPC
jgi:hypothetical protein